MIGFATRHPAWAAIGTILAVAALAFGGWYLSHLVQRSTAEVRGETAATEKVLGDGDRRIAAYEEFYDRCHSVVAIEGKIALAEEAKDSASGDWEAREAAANLLALQNQRLELIEAYNSDASKEDTQANFLASDLPHQLDPDKDTECNAR